jgi:hypothetical protein
VLSLVRYKQIHYLLRRPFIFEIVLVIIVIIKSRSKEQYVLYIPFRKNLKHWLKCKIKKKKTYFAISRCRNETYFALPAVVRRVTCRRSLYNTAIRGPCDLTRVSRFGSLTCLKLFGIPFREWITVPVAKVPLFLRSCISFGLVNQLSIVTWWWSPNEVSLNPLLFGTLKHILQYQLQMHIQVICEILSMSM